MQSTHSQAVTPPALFIVAATPLDEATFLHEAPLARTLALHGKASPLRVKVAFNNREGLPTIYDRAIAHVRPEEIVVFCHDDVALDDPWLPERLAEALGHFDVVGVAGCAEPHPAHSSWTYGHVQVLAQDQLGTAEAPPRLRFDAAALAGRMREGTGLESQLTVYGPAPRAVQLLDGCFLAVRGATLLNSGLRFDTRFDFHFYDLDFCRSATSLGLRLGVWPLGMSHASGGAFGSDGWQANLARYWGKWPPPSRSLTPQALPSVDLSPVLVERFNAANAALNAANWGEALAGFDTVLAAAPHLPAVHLGRARCLVMLGEWMSAREAFAACLRLEPAHYSAWLEAGHLCRQMGEVEQALASYRRAVAVEGGRHEAWLGLTRTLEQAGRDTEAAQVLTEAQRTAAQTAPDTLRKLWQLLGKYRLERGDLPRALMPTNLANANSWARVCGGHASNVDQSLFAHFGPLSFFEFSVTQHN